VGPEQVRQRHLLRQGAHGVQYYPRHLGQFEAQFPTAGVRGYRTAGTGRSTWSRCDSLNTRSSGRPTMERATRSQYVGSIFVQPFPDLSVRVHPPPPFSSTSGMPRVSYVVLVVAAWRVCGFAPPVIRCSLGVCQITS